MTNIDTSRADGGLKNLQKISISTLNEWLVYDSETGCLKWKKRKSPSANAGDIVGCKNSRGYIHFRIDKISLTCHRTAWAMYYGEWPELFIDHINGDRSDNKISNLRLASRSENNRNAAIRKDNKTGMKGVRFCLRDKKYIAHIRINGKSICLGYFDSAIQAQGAYAEKAKEIHGEFLNTGISQ